ncbi:M23 family metallopeptidase [Mucilaginibacter ximonensis]|uniref:M23 family metallopeptidase n=1 Tax=Mucilaginibacter ximonensis TaxID=538021 RepID=A0ABW5Y8U0_9SPHI
MTRKAVIYPTHKNSLLMGFYLPLATFLLLLIPVFTARAQVNNAPIEVLIPHLPAVIKGSDNRLHLAYELHITNFYHSTGPLTVKSLSVFGDKSLPIIRFSDVYLLKLLNSEEMPGKGEDLIIPPGQRKVLFVWLTLPSGAVPPQRLYHKITLTDKKKTQYKLTGAVTMIDQKKLSVLGPPLRGHSWFIDEGPGNPKSHHWGSLLAQNGIVTIPQRYAIDFFGLNDAGHAVEAAPGKLNKLPNKKWTGFGTEVLAVHDAVVRDMRDGIADHEPLAPLPEPKEITAPGLYGNFIVLEISPGVFVHYAHLQHGSIKVHIGQRVKLGDIIARLGDSGNAGAPHLHFHVSDKPTFELSEGMPFVFSTIDLLGKTNEAAMLDPTSKLKTKTVKQNNVLPLFGDVVRF